MVAFTEGSFDALIAIYMAWNRLTLRAPLLRMAQRPAEAQQRTLAAILRANAATEFGREHGFADIASLADYRARVPVRDYDAFAPYIERQAREGVSVLTAAPPVFYARTSGTTGRFKDLPLTPDGLRQIKKAQKLLGLSLYAATDFFKGEVLGFASPVVEGTTAWGAPYGSTSGGAYRSVTPVVSHKFFVPPEAYAVEDYDWKYRLYALAAIAASNATGLVTANPSTILRILDIVAREGAALIELLEHGADARTPEAVAPVVAEIRARSRNPSRRARDLRACLAADGQLTARAIWPRLSAVATWTGGSCGVALDQLAPQLPDGTRVVEFGYGASEFMGTANVDAARNTCLPQLGEHVYEFIPRGAKEAGAPVFLGVEELTVGDEYYVVVTTRSGLYRYDINDIVRAEEGVDRCVGLRFLQKGRGVTSITGEKLSEHQAIAAIGAALRARGLATAFYMLLADEQASRYVLLLEMADNALLDALAADVDAALQAGNAEYAAKRASGRLGHLHAGHLDAGAGERIKREALAAGVREAQYKPVVLDYQRNWVGRLPELRREGVDA